MRGKAVTSSSPPAPGRARRLFAGWSANLFQMVLGITQQVALIPVFLHYWTGDTLAMTAQDLDDVLRAQLQRNSVKDAVAHAVELSGRPRREVYARALELSREIRGGDGQN